MSQPSRASEDSILACLARHFPATHPSLLLGRGDDCAVLKAGTPLCVSSDLFLEDVHFRRSYFTPEEIGHKALAVNVSDIAACGGTYIHCSRSEHICLRKAPPQIIPDFPFHDGDAVIVCRIHALYAAPAYILQQHRSFHRFFFRPAAYERAVMYHQYGLCTFVEHFGNGAAQLFRA